MISACRAECPGSNPGRGVLNDDTTIFLPSFVSTAVSAALRQLLWYLVAGTRGGVNRARIIVALHTRPYNAHQLSEALQLDYRTVRHHLDLHRGNGLITQPAGGAYASPYFLAQYLEANYGIFEDIHRHMLPSEGK